MLSMWDIYGGYFNTHALYEIVFVGSNFTSSVYDGYFDFSNFLLLSQFFQQFQVKWAKSERQYIYNIWASFISSFTAYFRNSTNLLARESYDFLCLLFIPLLFRILYAQLHTKFTQKFLHPLACFVWSRLSSSWHTESSRITGPACNQVFTQPKLAVFIVRAFPISGKDRSLRRVLGILIIPFLQEKPSPVKPLWHLQEYEPAVFMQLAAGLQPATSKSHSSASTRKKCKYPSFTWPINCHDNEG